MRVSVIVPTYNEGKNLKPLIEKIASTLTNIDYEIIVVDDNSPDGSAEIATELGKTYKVRVIKRAGKLGLASAILEGFKSSNGDVIGVIDADLQHPPELIRELANAVDQGYDISIGSRYVNGGDIANWSLLRRFVSKGATFLARPLINVKDPMSGYFFTRKNIYEGLSFSPTGYKLLLELLVKSNTRLIKEIPYTFGKRESGDSKLGKGEYIKYLKLLLDLYKYKLKSHPVKGYSSK